MASSIRWLNRICSGRCAIPWAGRRSENMVDQFGLFSLLSLVFIRYYLFSCHALFSFHRIAARAPVKRSIRTRSGKTFTGVFPGSLLLSIPEQPSLFMLASALCLIICPNSVSAGGAANAVPAQVKSLAAGSCKASRRSWRTLRGSLFCPGGYPYCWYAIFKEQ